MKVTSHPPPPPQQQQQQQQQVLKCLEAVKHLVVPENLASSHSPSGADASTDAQAFSPCSPPHLGVSPGRSPVLERIRPHFAARTARSTPTQYSSAHRTAASPPAGPASSPSSTRARFTDVDAGPGRAWWSTATHPNGSHITGQEDNYGFCPSSCIKEGVLGLGSGA